MRIAFPAATSALLFTAFLSPTSVGAAAQAASPLHPPCAQQSDEGPSGCERPRPKPPVIS